MHVCEELPTPFTAVAADHRVRLYIAAPFSCAMSHWGMHTGWGLEAQRVAFLRERYKAERRHREISQLSPRGRDQDVAALQSSMALAPPSARVFGIGAMPQPTSPSQAAASPPRPTTVSGASASPSRYPALSTTAQVSFSPPDPDFVDRFKAGKEYGKPHDSTTVYREHVFGVWNTFGVKQPASFR